MIKIDQITSKIKHHVWATEELTLEAYDKFLYHTVYKKY